MIFWPWGRGFAAVLRRGLEFFPLKKISLGEGMLTAGIHRYIIEYTFGLTSQLHSVTFEFKVDWNHFSSL